MSEPLEKLTEFDYQKDSDKVLEKLNAAIDRINELSIDNKWLNEMLATLISDHSELNAAPQPNQDRR